MATVYMKYAWHLYVFDVAERKVCVFDPTVSRQMQADLPAKHGLTAIVLLEAFLKCCKHYWGSNRVSTFNWGFEYHGTYRNER